MQRQLRCKVLLILQKERDVVISEGKTPPPPDGLCSSMSFCWLTNQDSELLRSSRRVHMYQKSSGNYRGDCVADTEAIGCQEHKLQY